MKTCIFVNCFANSNEMRIEPIRDYFENRGYRTIYLASDFHHAKKEFVELPQEITPIHTKAYKKNLSVSRLYSHYDFANKVYKKLCELNPDVIYIKFPPNSLVRIAYKYKQHHNCKIILDVFDLWPESLPISNYLKKILFPITSLWALPRNRYIKYADLVLTECEMYKIELKKYLPNDAYTLYLTKSDIDYEQLNDFNGNNCKLCYLGGINNLIDIDLIGKVINKLNNRFNVSLDIIGDGYNRDQLINTAEQNGATVCFHGILYDEEEKYEIMKHCHFGLNLMKSTVKVALSLKSIEYFRAGLALINNIPEDTWKIVEENAAGINLYNIDILDEVKDFSIINNMKINARDVYLRLFSKEAFVNNLNSTMHTL